MGVYLSPKVEVKESPIEGKGLFAIEKIQQGETIVDWTYGPGTIMSLQEAGKTEREYDDFDFQVDRNSVLVLMRKEEVTDGDYVNHSCDANCGISGKFQMVSMRDIEPGEELTYDYAMSDSGDESMECLCNSIVCRKIITGNDWKIKELQEKYVGFFSPYLEQEIERQHTKKWYNGLIWYVQNLLKNYTMATRRRILNWRG